MRGWCRGAGSATWCSAGSAGPADQPSMPRGDPQVIGGGRGGKKNENGRMNWQLSGQILYYSGKKDRIAVSFSILIRKNEQVAEKMAEKNLLCQ